jgi:hypothetical protein
MFQQLIAITSSLQVYGPPIRPYETYTQGYWYAIAAAAFYLFCSVMLMINMLGTSSGTTLTRLILPILNEH